MHSFLYPALPSEALAKEGPDTLHIHPDKSIGIEEVRRIQSFLSRKPLTEKNVVVIFSAHLLTIPAQHALLKTLEEPPGNSLIYLVTRYPDSLLPTILSRVQIIPSGVIPSAVEESLSNLIRQILSAKVGDRLKILDSQNFTRESFSSFLDQFEIFIHKQLLPPLNVRGGSEGVLYELIADSRKYLKSNCNLKLIMDYFALNLHP